MAFDYAQATQRIGQYEGIRSKVYLDSMGHPTVGMGFNLDRSGAAAALAVVGADYAAVRAGTATLTQAQIDALAKTDLDNAVNEAQGAVSNFDSLSPARQFVVVDMIFNLGLGGFEQFHHTISAIEASQFDTAAQQMEQSAWYGQVGSRAVENVALMRSGDWSGTGSSGQSQSVQNPTPAAASAAPTYPGELTMHSSGDGVTAWQERLVSLGYPLTVDGQFGQHTEQATAQFQTANSLYASGVVDEATWTHAWA